MVGEQKVVVPCREGRRRIYSGADLIDILTIEQLRRRKISLQQVRRVLRFLHTKLRARLADLVGGKREHHLLLDGAKVYLETDTHQILDLLRNTEQPVFLICLSDVVRRLDTNTLITLKAGSGKRSVARAVPAARRKEVG